MNRPLPQSALATGSPAPDTRLKIVRIIARLNVGGPARHVVLLNRGLNVRGYDTLLVHGAIGPGEASMADLAAASGLRARHIAALGRGIDPLSDLRAFVVLLRLLFRERPDVVHTHTAKAGTLGRLCAAIYNATRGRSRRALVVHTFHGHVFTGYFNAIASAAVRWTERALAMLTDCIVTISPAQASDIVTRFRIAPADSVVTIPLGLDLGPLLDANDRRADLREALHIPAEDVVFGFVGRFVPVKDLETLVQAFARAHHQMPRTWLVLAGGGPTRSAIERAAAAGGIADRLRFIGWAEDLAVVYAAMDVCVLSSLNEGTPVALIEAMATGKPVVATAVGGVGDVVEHDRTGFLVPARNVEALAGALIRVASDARLRDEMGTLARASVVGRFDYHRLVDDVDALYRSRVAVKRGTIR